MIQLDNLKLELPALKAILMEVGESLWPGKAKRGTAQDKQRNRTGRFLE